MLFIRLKQCETAIAGGRLDEAFGLASAADVRAHRRGQDLVDSLVKALVERGRAHLGSGRLSAAMADCDKAARLAGNSQDVAKLRAAVAHGESARREWAGAQDQAILNARRFMAQGQMTIAQDVLAAPAAQGDLRAEALRSDAASRKAGVERAVAAAKDALDRDDWQAAMDHVGRARSLMPMAVEVRQVSRRIALRITDEINELIEAGRLDRAEVVLRRANGLAETQVELESLRRAVARCREAARFVRGGQFRQAHEILRGLATIWPRARWIEASIRHVSGIGESLDVVRSGPLGLLSAGSDVVIAGRPAARDDHTTLAADRYTPVSPMPWSKSSISSEEQFTLQVDGVGSFVVMRGAAVRIGPISAGAVRGVRPDVALMTDAGAPTITITRSDEDYFLQSAVPVGVNDRPVTGKLLCDGDRIALGPRCRIMFRRPNAASATAVLDISGARLGRGDARQVILMDREIILGDASSAHIRTRELRGPAVLLASGGRLSLKAEEEIAIEEHPAGRVADIVGGAHVRVGSLSFVVTDGHKQQQG